MGITRSTVNFCGVIYMDKIDDFPGKERVRLQHKYKNGLCECCNIIHSAAEPLCHLNKDENPIEIKTCLIHDKSLIGSFFCVVRMCNNSAAMF